MPDAPTEPEPFVEPADAGEDHQTPGELLELHEVLEFNALAAEEGEA